MKTFTLDPAAMPDGYGDAILPLALVKAHLRIDGDEDDDLVAALRDAALQMVEQWTGWRLLMDAEADDMTARFDGFGDRMRLGRGPVSTLVITGIGYSDGEGGDVTLDASDYWLRQSDGTIMASGGSWPSDVRNVVVTFRVGPSEVAAIPGPLKTAALMFTAHLYEQREAVVTGTISGEAPLGFVMLCAPYVIYSL